MPTVDGIASGIQTTELINSLVDASSGPLRAMQRQVGDLESKKYAVSTFKSRLQDVVSTIKDMDGTDELPEFNVTQSSDEFFSVSADSNANPGSYEIKVNTLAQADSWAADGVAEQNTSIITNGTYSITHAGTATDITIDGDNDSLEGLAGAINEIDGVTAYVLNTNADSNPYRLVVSSDETGEDNTLDLSALTDLTFSNMVTGRDAEIEVNGITVTSSDNSFQDSIPGVDITVNAAQESNADSIQVTVNRDADAIADKVQNFVDRYNNVVMTYNSNSKWDPENGIRGALMGDSTVRGIVEKMGVMVASEYDLGGDVTSLAQLGVATTRDGTLSFDASAFKDELGDSYQDVVNLLTDDDGPLGTVRDQLDDVYLDAHEGTLKSRTDSLEETIEGLEDSIMDFEDRMTAYAGRLRDQFTSMEVVLGDLFATQSYLTQLFSGNQS